MLMDEKQYARIDAPGLLSICCTRELSDSVEGFGRREGDRPRYPSLSLLRGLLAPEPSGPSSKSSLFLSDMMAVGSGSGSCYGLQARDVEAIFGLTCLGGCAATTIRNGVYIGRSSSLENASQAEGGVALG